LIQFNNVLTCFLFFFFFFLFWFFFTVKVIFCYLLVLWVELRLLELPFHFYRLTLKTSYSDLPFSPSSPAVAGEAAAALWNDRGNDHTMPISPPLPRATASTPFFHTSFDVKYPATVPQPGLELKFSAMPRQSSWRSTYWELVDDGAGRIDMRVWRVDFPAVFSSTDIPLQLDPSTYHTVEQYVTYVDGVVNKKREELCFVRISANSLSFQEADGSPNDLLCLVVDSVAAHCGTTWEAYYRDTFTGPREVIAVDSLAFLARGTAVPANAGNGFLFDNVIVDNAAPPTTCCDMGCCASPISATE
jgi:hypothetical protein